MRVRLFAGCLELAAIVCFGVAYLNRHAELEGVYFNSTVGGKPSLFDPFDPWDGYLWLGAGIAFALVGVAVLLLGRFFAKPA